MARINVETCWWADPRREHLKEKIGLAVDTVMLMAWRVSQEYWAKGRHLVPVNIFNRLPHAKEIVDSDLASIENDFVYVRGSREYHEWRLDRIEAGRKGGLEKSRKRNYREIFLANSSKLKQNLPSSSSSSSSSKKEEYIYTKFSKEDLADCVEVWGKSIARFKVNKNPKFDEVNIGRLIQKHGVEKTKLALAGAGFEQKTENYDPAKHVSIMRLFKTENFEKFINLGAQVDVARKGVVSDVKI